MAPVTARPLTYLGGDVRLVGRRADGRAVVRFLDRAGRPAGPTAEAWPHELRGVGWHIAAIKRAIAAAPLFGSGAVPPAVEAPRPILHAHFAQPKES